MSNLNYNNYIYLFIDPYSISIDDTIVSPIPFLEYVISEKSGKDFYVSNNLDFSQVGKASTYLESNATNLNYQIFNDLRGTIGDAPLYNTQNEQVSPERVQAPIDYTPAFGNINIAGNNAIRKTSDFAVDPLMSNRFVISDAMVKFSPNIISPLIPPNLASSDKYWTVSPLSNNTVQYGDLTNSEKEALANQAKELIRGIYGYIIQLKKPLFHTDGNIIAGQAGTLQADFELKPKTSSNFQYEQSSYLLVKGENNETFVEIGKPIKQYFASLFTDNNSVDPFGGYTMDCSTKIGVPYDYRTVIDDKADEKISGVVKTGQPTYEAVYNYYDPQYETSVVDTLEANRVTEKSLPSIYDFLYLPIQEGVLSNFLSLPQKYNLSLDNINFSNINNYLDSFSEVFRRYGVGFNLEDMPTEWIVQYLVGVNDKKNTAETNPFDSFLFTDKSILLKSFNKTPIKVAIQSNKGKRIPLWQEDLKSGFYFSENTMQYFNQAKEYETVFPFYCKVDIPVEQKGPIAKLLSQNNLLDSFNTHAASLVTPNFNIPATIATIGNFYGGLVNGHNPSHFNLLNLIKLKTFNLHFTKKETLGDTSPTDTYNLGTVNGAPGYDIPINKLSSQPPDYYSSDVFIDSIKEISLQTPKNVFIYSEEDTSETPSGISVLLQELKQQKFIEDIKELLKDRKFFRTPKDIHDGELAHQETLMYEIAKYKIVSPIPDGPSAFDESTRLGGEEYLQSIFLPITDQDKLTYYDTQVQPYKDYFYKIFAHKVIVGTKYRPVPYESLENNVVNFLHYFKHPGYNAVLQEADGAFVEFKYEVEPYFKFVRVPYYNTKPVNISTDALNFSTIEDLPPLPPQVNIVPFRNINNKILILLNNSSGRLKAKHQSIVPTDDGRFIKTYQAQGQDYTKKDAMIMFGGDDFGGTFEMFRTENMPMVYQDMHKDATLVRRRISMSSPSLIDKIIPNVDYYYTFRTIDVHEKLSNPTDIYKVRMIQEQGIAPYVKIELINVAESRLKQLKKNTSYTKDFKKYLRLKVAGGKSIPKIDPQTQVNEDGLVVGDYETLSVNMNDASEASPDGIFGKKYKMRITSKQTGKKIDINFRVKSPENIINKTQD